MNRKRPVFFIVKNRALGDSIMGLSTVQYLRDLYPESRIIYAVPAWIAPLYKNVKTAADEIYPLRLNSISDWFDLYAYLMNEKVDAIHEMHQSGRGHKVFSLFHFISRVPYTFHNHHLTGGTKVIDQGEKKELIQRDLDGVYSFYGKEKSVPSFLEYEPELKVVENLEKYPMIILGVVATRETKKWSLKNYVELSRLIYNWNPKIAVVIPLSKSSEDQKTKETLFSMNLPDNLSILQWDLDYLPIAFKQASLYIGNDTGLKHLAISVGVKTYTFFGPEPAREWHPYDKVKHPYFYLEGLSCRTRTHHYCGLSVCDLKENQMQCLESFRPESVFEIIKNELN